MTTSITCPYCNATIRVQPGTPSGQRIVCPRCGDSFPLRSQELRTAEQSFSPAPPSSEVQPAVTGITTAEVFANRRRANRVVALLVLGVMVVMAGGGLTFALLTQKDRRAHDTGLTGRPKRSPVPVEEEFPMATVPPDKLPALGYLPSGTNLLLAAQFAELVLSPTGKQLLQDPIKIGGERYPLGELPGWVGLGSDDVDHVVLGVKFSDAVVPPVYLVVRTREPYDGDALRQRLKGKRIASSSKKVIFSFRSLQKDFPLFAWMADPQTLVLALASDQLDALPSRPHEDLTQLPDDLRAVLKERRELGSPLWAAGDPRTWSKTASLPFFTRLKKEDLEQLGQVRSFAVWVQPDKVVTIKASFQCKDAAAAHALEQHFRPKEPHPDHPLKTAFDGPWLNLQYQFEADRLAKWLNPM
jgi:hypothetical protein